MSYEISLDQIFASKDTELYGRLPEIRKKAQPLLSYTHGKFPYYTPHDFSHSTSVEENLNWLVPDQLKAEMNAHELFFLIIAAWLHDWGMVGEEGEDPETIREEHHLRTEAYFESLYDKLNLSEHEARIVGRISKGHRKVDLNTEEYNDVIIGQNIKIRRRFLAALLRIADECDITHNRTPEIVYYSINPKDQAEVEFEKHLSVSGIGQLEEKHKIYITAIARDPKGARTLREVAEKIQSELDAVKSVLAQNGMTLDLVELRLETRGFIDKPIGFEINKDKIVDLLIGDHLYSHQDVGIRELVQNSIDSCKVKESITQGFSCKIIVQKGDDNTLIIEDNGLGMDYYEAKEFLSSIGSSFYKSELFKDSFGGKGYTPISQFGIGILSSFLICNGITIETLKEGQEACKFSVESVNEEWKYEKGSLINSGTKITLELNEVGKAMKLEDSLLRYFLCPEIPIEYIDRDGEPKMFVSAWDSAHIYQRFMRAPYDKPEEFLREILNESREGYDIIICRGTNWHSTNFVLFNHGIYVEKLNIGALDERFFVFVNLKTNLVDLHISREKVKDNKKWSDFRYLLFSDIFRTLKKTFERNDSDLIIRLFSEIINERFYFEVDSEAELIEGNPFLKSFLEHAPFPIIDNGEVGFIDFWSALNSENLTIYNCCHSSLKEELKFVLRYSKITPLVVNPYELPLIRKGHEGQPYIPLLKFLLHERKISHAELDLRQILVDLADEVDVNYPELLPENVRFATFGTEIKPLVVIYKQPIIEKHEKMLGAAYWGNILLWKQLLDKERVDSYLYSIRRYEDDRYDRIKTVDEPVVYIDASDGFISSVLNKREQGQFDHPIPKNIHRYLKYLSYLPLVVHDTSSCLIFLEVIDKLEADIATSLELGRPQALFQRMSPDSKLFLEYFTRFGLDYEER